MFVGCSQLQPLASQRAGHSLGLVERRLSRLLSPAPIVDQISSSDDVCAHCILDVFVRVRQADLLGNDVHQLRVRQLVAPQGHWCGSHEASVGLALLVVVPRRLTNDFRQPAEGHLQGLCGGGSDVERGRVEPGGILLRHFVQIEFAFSGHEAAGQAQSQLTVVSDLSRPDLPDAAAGHRESLGHLLGRHLGLLELQHST
mmetsp:Transcript_30626/g.76033  ORF Transcript_30626/g.76033 Transcript_30626/m.76033 type:complete len:200 (+) Transcript_30626:507-1106(+)